MTQRIESESSAVHWYEGMQLHPHHFQTSSRRTMRLLAEKDMSMSGFWWGVADLQVNRTALSGFRFKIDRAVLRLKDGTWVNVPDNASVSERVFEGETAQLDNGLDVWLAVRRPEPNTPLVHPAGQDPKGTPRPWIVREHTSGDENSGENEQVIQTRLWNGQVFFGVPPGDLYEAIKIGELAWSSAKQPVFRDDYIPPLINVGASLYLRDRLKNVVVKLKNQASFLQSELAAKRISLTSDTIRVLSNLTRLRITSSYSLVLQQMLNVSQTHPFSLYLELLRLIGELQVLYPDNTIEVPHYDHDNLRKVMGTVLKQIEKMVEGGVVVDYIHRRFDIDGEQRLCRIDREWLDPEQPAVVQVYLCIASEMTESQVDSMLSDYRVKIGPPSKIDELLISRTRGIMCQRLRRIPAGLPDKSGLHYYQIDLSRNSEFWQDLYRDLFLVIYGIPVEATSDISLYVHLEKGAR